MSGMFIDFWFEGARRDSTHDLHSKNIFFFLFLTPNWCTSVEAKRIVHPQTCPGFKSL